MTDKKAQSLKVTLTATDGFKFGFGFAFASLLVILVGLPGIAVGFAVFTWLIGIFLS